MVARTCNKSKEEERRRNCFFTLVTGPKRSWSLRLSGLSVLNTPHVRPWFWGEMFSFYEDALHGIGVKGYLDLKIEHRILAPLSEAYA